MKCPKCKDEMSLKGKYIREVILNVDKTTGGFYMPQYFEEEIECMTHFDDPDKVFWECECGFIKEVK